MKKSEKFLQKVGEREYLNKNCWLIRSLGYAPYKRCQYCELKFRNCLFLHYQITSAILLILIFLSSFLIEKKISEFLIIVVFALVIVYGHFFNKSTDRIIKANFAQRKANEALEELNKNLEKKVAIQTKEIKKAYEQLEKVYEIEKKAHQQEKENRKRAEKLVREFERLDRAKTQFILATQHHLRTPLSIIKSYTSMLLEGDYGQIEEKTKKPLSEIYEFTEKLIKLVNEFLDISQLQIGQELLKKEEVEIEEIIKEIIKELEPFAREKNLYLNFKAPKGLPKIKLDREKIKTALFNIIDNGIRYTEKGGVTINLEMRNSNLQIAVSDTGIGLIKEEAKDIFSEFFVRGKRAEKIYTTGRGIGLYIAKNIIEAHNGKIWAESEGEGRGSTFYIELQIN